MQLVEINSLLATNTNQHSKALLTFYGSNVYIHHNLRLNTYALKNQYVDIEFN